jgi:hypothetical protein
MYAKYGASVEMLDQMDGMFAIVVRTGVAQGVHPRPTLPLRRSPWCGLVLRKRHAGWLGAAPRQALEAC